MSEILAVAFAAYPLILSGAALFWLIRFGGQSRRHWVVLVMTSGSMMAYVFLAGSWAFTSYYLRYAFPVLFALVALFLFFRTRQGGDNAWGSAVTISRVSVFLLFAVLNILAIGSYFPSAKTLDVDFPFRSGSYYVFQGGASAVTNPFHALSGSTEAIDIVKLNVFGNRADGIAPRALTAYEIFGETLYSPCQGLVERVRDNLPDNAPGHPDTERTEGNYIVLRCAGAAIFMAHLRRGSIKVTPGELVAAGAPLAEIGNSGNTMEPHLHISATENDMGGGLQFNGRSLSINSVIRRD